MRQPQPEQRRSVHHLHLCVIETCSEAPDS
jgi:hypothetical protein